MAKNNPGELAARRTRDRKLRHLHFCYRVCMVACVALGMLIARWMEVSEFRHDPPPCQQKLQVLTYGWMDKNGNWRSYDNGEEIQVKGWAPN